MNLRHRKRILITSICLVIFCLAIALLPRVFDKDGFTYIPDPVVNIIFDTDIDSDVDDVGALGLIHSYVQDGKANLLAVICCCKTGYAAPCVDAINTYYGSSDIAVGVASTSPGRGISKYQQIIAQTYDNDIVDDDQARPALDVYREKLAKARDHSVVLIIVGTMNTFQELLQSKGDSYSSLSGLELVRKKVKLCSIMAGKFPSGSENNMCFDPAASSYVADNCPAPIAWSGWEIGNKIKTGNMRNQLAEDDPVRKSYNLYFGDEITGRESWDLTSVFYAVEGAGDYWDIQVGFVTVDPVDGSNTWTDDLSANQAILVEKMSTDYVADAINTQMIKATKESSEDK